MAIRAYLSGMSRPSSLLERLLAWSAAVEPRSVVVDHDYRSSFVARRRRAPECVRRRPHVDFALFALWSFGLPRAINQGRGRSVLLHCHCSEAAVEVASTCEDGRIHLRIELSRRVSSRVKRTSREATRETELRDDDSRAGWNNTQIMPVYYVFYDTYYLYYFCPVLCRKVPWYTPAECPSEKDQGCWPLSLTPMPVMVDAIKAAPIDDHIGPHHKHHASFQRSSLRLVRLVGCSTSRID